MKRAVDPVAETLGRIVMDTVRDAEALRAQGAPADVVVRSIEAVIRERWPRGRAEQWHLLCDRCVDTGYEIKDCPGDATCGRTKVHAEHRFAEPCWCAKGRQMIRQPRQEADELASVGKVTKPSRWGR